VLLHDEGPTERDHHEHAEQAAEDGDERDADVLEIVAENEQRGHGDAYAEGNRLTGGARGLDDVIFEDRGAAAKERAEHAEKRDREDGDGDGGRDGQANLEDKVEGRSAENDAEDGAADDGGPGEFGRRLVGGDVGLVGRRRVGAGRLWHARVLLGSRRVWPRKQ